MLTFSSYDGEADDPAPPPAPTAAEPEDKPEPVDNAPVPEQTQAQQPAEAMVKNEQDHNMREVKQETTHDDDYDRPLHIKDDGYVRISLCLVFTLPCTAQPVHRLQQQQS